MEFSEQLKIARMSAKLTQQQVADIIGVDKSTYCGYETDKRQPDVQKIKNLAKALDVTSDFLLDLDIKQEQTKSPATLADDEAERLALDTEIMRVFSELPEDRQRLALDVIARILEAFAEN